MTVTIILRSTNDPKSTNGVILRDANKIQRIVDQDNSKIIIEDNWTQLGSFFVEDIQKMIVEFDKQGGA